MVALTLITSKISRLYIALVVNVVQVVCQAMGEVWVATRGWPWPPRWPYLSSSSCYLWEPSSISTTGCAAKRHHIGVCIISCFSSSCTYFVNYDFSVFTYQDLWTLNLTQIWYISYKYHEWKEYTNPLSVICACFLDVWMMVKHLLLLQWMTERGTMASIKSMIQMTVDSRLVFNFSLINPCYKTNIL